MRGYNVKAASRLSGLSAHTLRAWEKRYQVVQPARSDGRQRLYSPADIEKLSLLGRLTRQGHAIGTLAGLSLSELLSVAGAQPLTSGNAKSSPSENLEHLQGLLRSVELLDLDELDRQILKARIETPARLFALEVVSPLLGEVGRLVAEQQLDVSQEHALSAILRNHLGECLTQAQKLNPWQGAESPTPARILLATPEGEHHEFGILLAAIIAGSRGVPIRYLGPNLPAKSLVSAALSTGASLVVLGSVESECGPNKTFLMGYVETLYAGLRQGSSLPVPIWLGGNRVFAPGPELVKTGFRQFASLAAFDDELRKLEVAQRPR